MSHVVEGNVRNGTDGHALGDSGLEGRMLFGERQMRRQFGCRTGFDQLRRSTIIAIPWPPPTHMDSMP